MARYILEIVSSVDRSGIARRTDTKQFQMNDSETKASLERLVTLCLDDFKSEVGAYRHIETATLFVQHPMRVAIVERPSDAR